MTVDTHLAVLATVALYVILCIEVYVCPPLSSSLVASPYIRTLCLPDSLISSSKDQPLPLYSLRTSYGSLLRAYTTYYSPGVHLDQDQPARAQGAALRAPSIFHRPALHARLPQVLHVQAIFLPTA